MKRFNAIALLVFLGALAWVFFLKPESVGALRSTFLTWFSPVIKASGAVESESIRQDPRTREELLSEVARLEKQVFNLRFRQRTLAQLEKENARLRADLGFKQTRPYNLTIPAQVIKRNRTSWWSTVTINRGRKHQVTADLPVISRDHAVVGKVTPNGLTDETAEVLLLTDEQCQVAARIGQRVNMQGIVQGYRGLGNLTPEVRLTYLDEDVLLPAGALLYTDNFEGQIFPPGLLIGRVVEQIRGEYYDSAIIEPQVDFTKLDSVFVIRAADEEEIAAADAQSDGTEESKEDADSSSETGSPGEKSEPEVLSSSTVSGSGGQPSTEGNPPAGEAEPN